MKHERARPSAALYDLGSVRLVIDGAEVTAASARAAFGDDDAARLTIGGIALPAGRRIVAGLAVAGIAAQVGAGLIFDSPTGRAVIEAVDEREREELRARAQPVDEAPPDLGELVHYDPRARAVRDRLARALERRGLTLDDDLLSAAALDVAWAPRDTLYQNKHLCIRARRGLPCDGSSRCTCDIPF